MSVKLTVLVDNEAGGGLRSSWGLSILVEKDDVHILFDADTEPEVLEYNAARLGVDLGLISFAVLSHPHRDHYGGFSAVGKSANRVEVYVPRGSRRVARLLRKWGLQPIEVNETIEVVKGVYIVGPFRGVYKGREIPEQSLVIGVGDGRAVVLVGCGHPGVDTIIKTVVETLNVKPILVIGGFHEPPFDVIDRLASLVDGKICAIHCSGDETKRYIRERYPGKYCDARAGTVITL
ncbi:beta-lactamase domain-containing protein [Pyrolobus fumarii 1A]|uniref:Beta-lactamase domain-containing protein n=1 Tax=Pyrolobus fumarii (strain DSM 11204 / 1A) TaxID=694429 RepID=G0EF94_PYRF1|nr:MBL fold metallo-hydrolase [Pyrolobus fumarii]AEM38137.1 beta-lactamase domain-containing protein [Pyrolobus fumarii 1A]